jgi:hypothetical protein
MLPKNPFNFDIVLFNGGPQGPNLCHYSVHHHLASHHNSRVRCQWLRFLHLSHSFIQHLAQGPTILLVKVSNAKRPALLQIR